MKKTIIFVLITAMTLCLAACSHTTNKPASQEPSSAVEIPSPWEACDTLEEAENRAGFDIAVSEPVSDYTETLIRVDASVKGSEILELIYRNDKDEIRIRKSVGAGDNSGDYNDYAKKHDESVGGLSVRMSGNNDIVNLAIWTNGSYAYSVHADSGISTADMVSIVSGIQ